jgi:hypothetical protein
VNLKLRQLPFRIWVGVGTAVVLLAGLVVLILAYGGWTFGLGTHDKATTVTVALTVGAFLFGAVAILLAFFAYWSASGTPDLSVEIRFDFSEPNKPLFKVDPPDENGWVPIPAFKQVQGHVTVRNASVYAARNPGVRIRLHGLSRRNEDPGWTSTMFVNMLGAIEAQWDGGADEIIHGKWERVLPIFKLQGSHVLPGQTPSLEITVVADGVEPRTMMVPVQTATEEEWDEIMKARNEAEVESNPVASTPGRG